MRGRCHSGGGGEGRLAVFFTAKIIDRENFPTPLSRRFVVRTTTANPTTTTSVAFLNVRARSLRTFPRNGRPAAHSHTHTRVCADLLN